MQRRVVGTESDKRVPVCPFFLVVSLSRLRFPMFTAIITIITAIITAMLVTLAVHGS